MKNTNNTIIDHFKSYIIFWIINCILIGSYFISITGFNIKQGQKVVHKNVRLKIEGEEERGREKRYRFIGWI